MSKALNATGRAIGFNMCEWGASDPWKWGNNFSQSGRIAGDHSGNCARAPPPPETPPSTLTLSLVAGGSVKEQISKMASIPREYGGRPWYWNDMDMLQTGNGPQSGYDATFPPPNMTLEECERRNSRSWRPFPLTPERVSCRQTRRSSRCGQSQRRRCW